MFDEKIIFLMEGVFKIFFLFKKVLNNIWLSFFYGVKIGVFGFNGFGKFILFKIIVGKDENYEGKISFDGSYKIGMLEQELEFDLDKMVCEVVEEGVQDIVDLFKVYEVINLKFLEFMSDDEMNKFIEQ